MASLHVTYVITADDEDELARILEAAESFSGAVTNVDGLQVTLVADATQQF